eukprot:901188-Pyramimonas_sp.AAC.2
MYSVLSRHVASSKLLALAPCNTFFRAACAGCGVLHAGTMTAFPRIETHALRTSSSRVDQA